MPKEEKLNLYVWTEFDPSWAEGLAFAIAENETEARKLVEDYQGGVHKDHWGRLEIYPIAKKAFSIRGSD